MRGKQHKIIAGRMMDPSTPAYAGQTSLIFAFRLRRSLYPRICGANTASDLAAVAEVPLPPHMRGKHTARACRVRPAPSTPAYAGQTGNCGSREAGRCLYPRICGANDHDLQHVRRPLPSTPAYAGQTLREWRVRGISPLYPRICGANSVRAGPSVLGSPLPPHMRGKRNSR